MKYLKVWTDFTNAMETLKDAERGRLFTAMLDYAKQSTEPELVGNERFIWSIVRAEIDRQRDAYNHKCEVNRANGASRPQSPPVATNGSEPLQDYKIEDTTEEKKKPKKTIFSPPSVDQVAEYCQERKNGIDAQAFVDWYKANGWKVGKNPMKDWKAAVRTWEQRRKQDHVAQVDAAQKEKEQWDAWIRGDIE